MVWRWDEVLKTHPNGMRFSVFGQEGELLATNEYFRCVSVLGCCARRGLNGEGISVGGGFVVNDKTKGIHCFLRFQNGVDEPLQR